MDGAQSFVPTAGKVFRWPALRCTRQNGATIGDMVLARLAMRIFDVLFFAGLAGSIVVVVISFIEDGKELFGKD